jgi:hypothetical protein
MLKGQKMPAAGRAKLSAALRGRTIPPEVRAKISANSARIWLGKKLPPHVVAGMSERAKGKPAWNKGTKGAFKMPPHAVEAMRERMSRTRFGADNPQWQGGITPARSRIRCLAQYAAWRRSIFERDRYVCQLCGISNQKGLGKTVRMEADHYPVPFSVHLRRIAAISGADGLVDAARCDEELWNAEGRTLCAKCHKSTKRGRGTVQRAAEAEMRL